MVQYFVLFVQNYSYLEYILLSLNLPIRGLFNFSIVVTVSLCCEYKLNKLLNVSAERIGDVGCNNNIGLSNISYVVQIYLITSVVGVVLNSSGL